MLGRIDRERIQRAFDHLSVLGGNRVGCHSVNLNSFVQLQISRTHIGSYNVAVCRKEDQCLIVYFTASDGEEVVARIEKEMATNGARPKCRVCTGVAPKGDYCELCSIMTTRVEEVCAICIDEEKQVAVWVDPGCGHCYHHECLSKIRDARCPLCRKVIQESKII